MRALAFCVCLTASAQVGIFESASDVGPVLHKGGVAYDAASKTYKLSGSGENMWAAKDAFHFVWKKMSGDAMLSADIEIVSQGGDAHRKAVLMIRQSLDEDSQYVDAAVHGDGLTSLQFRERKGDATHEVQANVSGPRRLRLTKRGNVVYLSTGDDLRFSGATTRMEFTEPFYVGIGVCAHNKDRVETAAFSNVELTTPPAMSTKPVLHSTLESITVSSTDRRAVYTVAERIEAPNWSRDGKTLIYNSRGKLYRIAATGGDPQTIETGAAQRNNNDHGLSPDGTMLAISDQSEPDRKSRIHVVPAQGGKPRLVTQKAPSYWHGWSPDGKTLTYCAERNGESDVYTIPVEGGEETRLTDAKGLDDGPEYSPDGAHIYFNSDRTGTMQIWRMKPDGASQEQITTDEYNNWFPHVSPDGKQMVFLTYAKDVKGHPENKDVMLRVMNLADGKIRTVAKLFGGQGTINVPSWSPDRRRFAFVSYQLLP